MGKVGSSFLMVVFFVFCVFGKVPDQLENTKKPGIINQTAHMKVNNIKIMINNSGGLGLESAYYPANGSVQFLFSAGIGLSGYKQVQGSDSLLCSFELYSSRLHDYQPGSLGMDPDDPTADIYAVSVADTQGSDAYIKWVNAVALGAEYVNLDGQPGYDPNTDMPNIMGDYMLWTIYNDDTPLFNRRLGSGPLGVEIHQTMFGYERNDYYGDILFLKYRLINKDNVPINDAIFTSIADPDIGDYSDDLVGCDSTLNLGYAYNDQNDSQYGANPPAVGFAVLQGPIAESPGDTGFVYNGEHLGVDTLLNSINIPITSLTGFVQSNPNLGDPDIAIEARRLQEGGMYLDGTPIDPANFIYGSTSSAANPKFLFSGDPESGEGWLCTFPTDWRFLVNTGPFNIPAEGTQDILMAMIVTQGTDAKNSVTKLKDITSMAIDLLKSNFDRVLSVKDELPVMKSFQLDQNYPNPFNPTTTISFTLQKSETITLKVYNMVGQEVATIFNNEFMSSGNHSVIFDASDLPSGIYHYQLIADGVSETRKMVLLK